jgi:hypothetical protein
MMVVVEDATRRCIVFAALLEFLAELETVLFII